MEIFTHIFTFPACMPAAHLALEDVNNKQDLLPGFQLTLHSNDSEVSDDDSTVLCWTIYHRRTVRATSGNLLKSNNYS